MKQAFSILELIFAIAIMSIIGTIALPKLMNTKSTATASTIEHDITTIRSAVQSYCTTNNSIQKITDAVNINPSIWDITDTKITYKDHNQECVTMELIDDLLQININPTSGKVCQKIYDLGIRNNTIELFE